MPQSNAVAPARFTMADAAAVLAAALGKDDRFAAFDLSQIVQAHPNRIVARGRLGGRDVYLKLFNEPDGPQRVRAARAEYLRAQRLMGNGQLRVARHIASAPRLSLMAIESIEGPRFDFAVEAAAPERQRELHRLAAAWLKHFSRQSVVREAFDPARFLPTVRGLVLEGPVHGAGRAAGVTRPWVNAALGADDIARRQALRGWIVAAAHDADGEPISIAATHDDFSPRNFSLTRRGGLVGYDLGRLFRCPLAEAAAIFLVIQQLRQSQPAGRRLGLNADYVEGFRDSALLGEDEFRVLFPLYVGHKLDIMFSRHANRPDWLERLRLAVDAFLVEVAA